MNYIQFNPHKDLDNYIAAYWAVSGNTVHRKTEKIVPDGCVDILFNLGAECKTNNASFTMENGKVYLVGTMTRYQETLMNPETNGIGFESHQAEHIFGTFTRLNSKDEYEGTGLGLSLCKKTVERHRGSIVANGEPGKGATFIITPPFQQEETGI